MQRRLYAIAQLSVIAAIFLTLFYAGASAMGLSLKASWESGSAPSLADLDGDGTMEIISPSESSLHVWHGNGTAFGGWPASVTGLSIPPYPAVGDVDVDGQQEIVFADSFWGTIYVYESTGEFSWMNDSCLLETGMGIIDSSPILSDLDSDGNPDIIFSCDNMDYSSLYALNGTGDPLLGWESPKAADLTIYSPANLSGMVVVSGGVFGFPFSVQAFYADGSDAWHVNPDGASSTQSAGSSPAIGDVDGDGQQEIVAASYNDSSSRVYILGEGGDLENSWEVQQTAAPSPSVLADLDGDGKQDIIVYWADTVYAWNGSGSLLWSQNVGGAGGIEPAPAPAAADLDNDIIAEVLVPAPSSLLIFSSAGSLLLNETFDVDPNAAYYPIKSPAAGSVDSDALKEIVLGVNSFMNVSTYVFSVQLPCPDADSDGYNSSACGGTDCNDSDPDVHPGAAEACGNGLDEDCDQLADEGCQQPYCLNITGMRVLNSAQQEDYTILAGTMYYIEMSTQNTCGQNVSSMQIIQVMRGAAPVSIATLTSTIYPGETSTITAGFIMPSGTPPGTQFKANGFNWNHWIDQNPGTFQILSGASEAAGFTAE